MARMACVSLNPSCPTSFPGKPGRISISKLPLAIYFPRKPSSRVRSLSTSLIAVARYGGGSRRSLPNVRSPDVDYDPALDLDRIQSTSVRLLDEEQNMVGVVSKSEAIRMANNSELVLAIMSADADPPVLRLFDVLDYKKYKYGQQKKKRVQQKRSAANRMDLKELKMGYNIDSHDYSVRLRTAQRILKDGDKVKVIVNLKGRENEFRNIAIELIKRFQNDIGELATEESQNFRDRNIFIVLVPNKAVIQKEEAKKKETPVSEVSAKV
ncbi:putative translation initiation factor 3 [Dioscorea sansibarensis]